MNKIKYISLAGLLFPLSLMAQTAEDKVLCDFETTDSYKSVGVYDTWANSPFRTHQLSGNAQVVNNHLNDVDPVLGYALNESKRILGVQRSRFGSNTFGALVELKEPFALKKTVQYVHVKIYTPKGGSVMLIGLGNRDDRPNQSPLTEQFWSTSTSKVKSDGWCDAVFPISGSNGITIRNLLVVVDRNSPHNLTADYAAYIDDIILSPSASDPYFMSSLYPINYDEETAHSRGTDRYTKGVTLVSSDGSQSLEADQSAINRLYIKRMNNTFLAKPGDKVTAGFIKGAMSWMAGYVYIDQDNNGNFDVDYDDTGVKAMKDLMTYSQYKGTDCNGNAIDGKTGPNLNPPSFTIPADLKPGFYRMRYKVDWDNVNPGGNPGPSNKITDNGGMLLDTRINIHNDVVSLSRTTDELGGGGLNGDILMADGSGVTGKKVPFGQDLKVKVKPAPGFRFHHLVMRHGYNLEGDSVVSENRQWDEKVFYARTFQNDEFTIPGKYVDGDVRFIPYFSSNSGQEGGDEYAINFSEDLNMQDPTTNVLTSLKLSVNNGDVSTLTVKNDKSQKVYRNFAPTELRLKAGDVVLPTVTYKSANKAMNAYLYIDMNNDGRFYSELNADGTPGNNSELVSYSYYNGFNSRGETSSAEGAGWSLPSFRLPEELPNGIYRCRLKLDVNNIDPAGSWKEGDANNIDATGGYVVDFLLNVHGTNVNLEVNGVDGDIVGANYTGVPTSIPFKTAYRLLPLAPVSSYSLQNLVVRHGYNLDGEQYIHGNRQWSEYTVANAKESKLVTLKADSINGDVRITGTFAPNGTGDYRLVMRDEFDGEHGAAPDAKLWSYSTRENPTWKRFVAQSAEGKAATAYLSDGKLVTRCVANTFANEGNVEMVSGSVESSGKMYFNYGRIEGRLRTTPHTGNFPAFWLMPEDNSAGWPNAGEIDLWEQIDSEDRSYHTIHTHVSYDLKQGPTNTGNVATTAADYNVISFDWTPELLTWYVNGKKAFSYAKSTDQDLLNKGQWPFDKPFYVILNQSVGNGSWAQNCDPTFQYETYFDYVRIYQKDGDYIKTPTGIGETEAANSGLDVYVRGGKLLLVTPTKQLVKVYDVQGRTAWSEAVQGNRYVNLPKGVYVVNGHKVMIP